MINNKSTPIISLRNITTKFGNSTIHENLNLDVLPGEVLGLIGGSGTGKSVLLNTILGLNRPVSGEVIIMGTDIRKASSEEVAEIRKKWGVLFQEGALFSSLTVGDNIGFPIKEFTKMSEELTKDIALMKLILAGLKPDAFDKFPSELSGGMKKRAGLARALALDPKILMLDEPTAGLDPISASAFDQLILTLQKTLGLTICMATHDLDSLYAICDRVAVLADKKICAIGTIPELLEVNQPWIQEYFNGPRGRATLANKKGAEHGN